jgi:uncharacterized protein (DUF433 family)
MQVINHIEIQDGKAYIVGRGHLKAEMVARMVVDGNYSVQETMAHYNLSAGEVHAALAYYYDNRDALDQAREKQGEHINNSALNSTEHLEKLRSRQQSD